MCVCMRLHASACVRNPGESFLGRMELFWSLPHGDAGVLETHMRWGSTSVHVCVYVRAAEPVHAWPSLCQSRLDSAAVRRHVDS